MPPPAASQATPGTSRQSDGSHIDIAATITGQSKDEIIHVPAAGAALPDVGETVTLRIDWERRHRLMRMHTACHLLTVRLPLSHHRRSVGEEDSRIDFDMPRFRPDQGRRDGKADGAGRSRPSRLHQLDIG